jgi:D-alanyl-lipoteichoic acid acyltransferase DltB (MBOAT superfamily)
MTLFQISTLSIISLLAGWLPNRWRRAVILTLSLIAVYWLQPVSPIRNLDFWLPTAAIGLTLFVWAVTAPKETDNRRWHFLYIAAAPVFILILGATRYFDPLCCLTASRPPQLVQVMIACVLIFGTALVVNRFFPSSRRLAGVMIVVVIALFIVLKFQPSGVIVSSGLRSIYGQDPAMATALDISWLGFSYLAFRLLHTLRDFQTGRLPSFKSDEYTTYTLFYPSLTAGPIDRSQRFIQTDLRNPDSVSNDGRLLGIQRIVIGAFKKFVIADALALIALSPQLISQVNSNLWMWLLLYAFSLRIYFDFPG